MNNNPEKRNEVYAYIVAYKKAHGGNSPAMREIMDGCGIKSSAHVSYLLEKLELDGKLALEPGTRMITVVGMKWYLEAQP